MSDLPFYLDFSEPAAWHILLWVGSFAPALYVALWRSVKGESREKSLILRRAGFEVSFVVVPFGIYSVIHLMSSNLDTLLNSAELPMASLLLCFMTLRWILVTLKVSPNKLIANRTRLLKGAIVVMIIILLVLITRIITAQFNPEQSISSWYGVTNSLFFIFSFYFAYGIIGAMMLFTELPGGKEPELVLDNKRRDI